MKVKWRGLLPTGIICAVLALVITFLYVRMSTVSYRDFLVSIDNQTGYIFSVYALSYRYPEPDGSLERANMAFSDPCLLYTSDAADD